MQAAESAIATNSTATLQVNAAVPGLSSATPQVKTKSLFVIIWDVKEEFPLLLTNMAWLVSPFPFSFLEFFFFLGDRWDIRVTDIEKPSQLQMDV